MDYSMTDTDRSILFLAFQCRNLRRFIDVNKRLPDEIQFTVAKVFNALGIDNGDDDVTAVQVDNLSNLLKLVEYMDALQGTNEEGENK